MDVAVAVRVEVDVDQIPIRRRPPAAGGRVGNIERVTDHPPEPVEVADIGRWIIRISRLAMPIPVLPITAGIDRCGDHRTPLARQAQAQLPLPMTDLTELQPL